MPEVEPRFKVLVDCACPCRLSGTAGRIHSVGRRIETHVRGCACYRCLRPFGQPKPKPRRTSREQVTYQTNATARHKAARGRCELQLDPCTRRATETHHIYPQRSGLDDSYDNLRACCASCNRWVEDMGRKTATALGLYSETPLGDDAA